MVGQPASSQFSQSLQKSYTQLKFAAPWAPSTDISAVSRPATCIRLAA